MVAFLALGVASPVSAATNQDFDAAGGTPFVGENFPAPNAGTPPVVLGADGFSTGQFLRLLIGPGVTRTSNGVGFDLSDAGAFNRIVADFDFRITCVGARTGFGGGGCADGFSFLLLDTTVHGTSGSTGEPTASEHGALTLGGQFSLGFNTFLNPGFGPDANSSNSLSLLVNNGFVAGSFIPLSTSTFDLATGTFGNKGAFHHAQIDLVLGPGTPSVTVTFTHGITGLVIQPFLDFDLSAVAGLGPAERRVGSAARCGDACADYNLDNINVQFLDPVAGDDLEVCHRPPGNPENPRILRVTSRALEAHLRHGDDVVGPEGCDGSATTSALGPDGAAAAAEEPSADGGLGRRSSARRAAIRSSRVATALDQDGDGLADDREIAVGSDPLDATSTPALAPLPVPGLPGASALILALALLLTRRMRRP